MGAEWDKAVGAITQRTALHEGHVDARAQAEVMRVDAFAGPGLLLRLPGLPEGPAPAFCHVANALETKVKPEEAAADMTKKFKVCVSVCVGGWQPSMNEEVDVTRVW